MCACLPSQPLHHSSLTRTLHELSHATNPISSNMIPLKWVSSAASCLPSVPMSGTTFGPCLASDVHEGPLQPMLRAKDMILALIVKMPHPNRSNASRATLARRQRMKIVRIDAQLSPASVCSLLHKPHWRQTALMNWHLNPFNQEERQTVPIFLYVCQGVKQTSSNYRQGNKDKKLRLTVTHCAMFGCGLFSKTAIQLWLQEHHHHQGPCDYSHPRSCCLAYSRRTL